MASQAAGPESHAGCPCRIFQVFFLRLVNDSETKGDVFADN